MSQPFEMWSDRIASAESDASKRALLAELAVWRARHLTDVPASRKATHAMARLYMQVDQRQEAVREARSLLSLCQTPPEASDEELQAAQQILRSLGENVPQVRRAPERERRPRARDQRKRPERPVRPERPERPERSGGLGPARQAAAAGDWRAASDALQGMKGAGAALVRAYVDLSRALGAPDGQRAGQLEALQANLRQAAGIRAAREEAPAAPADDPLSKLLGAPAPGRRAARLRVIDRWLEEHPDRVDEMGEAVLRHHLATAGPETPAPWLVGVVGLAQASGDAPRTTSAIADLRQAGAFAVSAYDEWPFERLVRLMKRALATETPLGGLRRGILAREEPDDRKIWTLRLTPGGTERMIAVAPHATEPYAEGMPAQLAERLKGLCAGTVLLATGSGNQALRELAAERGLIVLEHDADDDALLAAAAEAGAPPAPRGPSPTERLKQALQAETFDPGEVKAAVGEFRRPDRALRPVLSLELDDERTATLLGAVHELSDPEAGIPEGTTVAIRAATTGPATRALLEGPARERFGGPGIETVVQLAKVLLDDGWHLHRVLRGPTRREGKVQPALQTLSGALGGLWRLLVRRGELRGEVWFVAELPIEGRAVVPLLLLEEHSRAVVLPVDADLLAWWATLQGAPTPIGWTGAEGDALREAVAGFQEVPRPEASPG